MIAATDRLLEFKLTYSKPEAVSRDQIEKDTITIKFDQSVWYDPNSDVEVNEGKPLVIQLPRQMDPETAAAMASAMDTANGAANTITTGNIVINILLGSSLKFLWGMINTLQFIVFFTEWNVIIPPNADMAIETLRVIALGEFIPYHWLTDPITEHFQKDEDEGAENQDQDGESENSNNILSNMGVMLLILCIIVILAITIILCSKICKRGSKIHDAFLKIKGKIFWNSIIRFIL